MIRYRCIPAAAIAAALAGPAAAQETARATLTNLEGQTVGEVTLTQAGYGTVIHAKLFNQPPGTHAFHVHAVGVCEPPFKSAAGHYNPTGSKHGVMDRDGMHAGDLPNVFVPASGELEFHAFAPRVNLDAQLFDSDGAAIVMHVGADDYASDPAGNAGARYACGVIQR